MACLLTTCSSIPERNITSLQDVDVEFNRIYVLKETLTFKTSNYIYDGANSGWRDKYYKLPAGTKVFFSTILKLGEPNKSYQHNALPFYVFDGHFKEEAPSLGGEDNRLFASIKDIQKMYKTDELIETSQAWGEYFKKSEKSFYHLAALRSPWALSVYEAKSRKLYISKDIEFFFSPQFKDCEKDELPILRAPTQYYPQYQDHLPSFSLVTPLHDGILFCIKIKDVQSRMYSDQPIVLPSEVFYKKYLTNWNEETTDELYNRINQMRVTRIPDLGVRLDTYDLKLSRFVFKFNRNLLGSCSGYCRRQGFDIVMNKDGQVLDILQKTQFTSLYYWQKNRRVEIKFEEGDIKRLVGYSNNFEKLEEIYALLDKGIVASDEKFVSRMSELYNIPEYANERRAGSAMVTYFIALAQARKKLQEKLTAISETPSSAWPSYGVKNFYFE